jgi:hypothetical protein
MAAAAQVPDFVAEYSYARFGGNLNAFKVQCGLSDRDFNPWLPVLNAKAREQCAQLYHVPWVLEKSNDRDALVLFVGNVRNATHEDVRILFPTLHLKYYHRINAVSHETAGPPTSSAVDSISSSSHEDANRPMKKRRTLSGGGS